MSSARPFLSLRAAVALFVVTGADLVACGGADSAPPKAPSSAAPAEEAREAEQEPRTVEEAQSQIARARADLGGAPTGSGGSGTGADSTASTSTDAKADASKKPSSPQSRPSAGAEPPREASPDACANPCRALTSMRRAVSALCRLTGDTDNRCSDARRTLSESEGRVRPCKC